jgi:hypothetical protein
MDGEKEERGQLTKGLDLVIGGTEMAKEGGR